MIAEVLLGALGAPDCLRATKLSPFAAERANVCALSARRPRAPPSVADTSAPTGCLLRRDAALTYQVRPTASQRTPTPVTSGRTGKRGTGSRRPPALLHGELTLLRSVSKLWCGRQAPERPPNGSSVSPASSTPTPGPVSHRTVRTAATRPGVSAECPYSRVDHELNKNAPPPLLCSSALADCAGPSGDAVRKPCLEP